MSMIRDDETQYPLLHRVGHLSLVGAWVEVEHGMWVGSSSGIYLGRIEATDGLFRAIDEYNLRVDDFDKLRDAVACLENLSRTD